MVPAIIHETYMELSSGGKSAGGGADGAEQD